MPCDTVTKMLVDAGKLSVQVVMRALTTEGERPVLSDCGRIVRWPGHEYNADTGKVTIAGRVYQSQAEQQAAKLKVSYSKQVVREQAKRFGWNIKQDGNKFTVVKRF